MPVSRFTLRRLTAAVLPLSFLWLCVVCAFICAEETAAAAGNPFLSSFERTEAGRAPACEGCPFATFPKTTAPERTAVDAGPQTAAADVPPSLRAFSSPIAVFVRLSGQSPPTALPLQLLPTLRI